MNLSESYKKRIKELAGLHEKKIVPFDLNNPSYKEAFLDRGDETEDTWNEYGAESVKNAIDEVKSLKFPLTIYRGLDIKNPEDFEINIDKNYIEGRSWTTNLNIAKSFGSGGYIVTAILQKDNIDWEGTISRRILHHALGEEEINVIDPRKLKIISIKKTSDVLKESTEISPPVIPNTMNFWHGGNLDSYDDIIAQKTGRYEYGPGLYATTSYEVVKRYAKGSRKLYLLTIEKGVDIEDAFIDLEKVTEFMNSYVIGSKRKPVMERLSKYIEDGKVPASIFNNLILNHQAIQSTKTKFLRSFLVSNGIDYEMVDNAFGFGEKMIVLYNMNKIINQIQIKPGDKIQVFDLPKNFN